MSLLKDNIPTEFGYIGLKFYFASKNDVAKCSTTNKGSGMVNIACVTADREFNSGKELVAHDNVLSCGDVPSGEVLLKNEPFVLLNATNETHIDMCSCDDDRCTAVAFKADGEYSRPGNDVGKDASASMWAVLDDALGPLNTFTCGPQDQLDSGYNNVFCMLNDKFEDGQVVYCSQKGIVGDDEQEQQVDVNRKTIDCAWNGCTQQDVEVCKYGVDIYDTSVSSVIDTCVLGENGCNSVTVSVLRDTNGATTATAKATTTTAKATTTTAKATTTTAKATTTTAKATTTTAKATTTTAKATTTTAKATTTTAKATTTTAKATTTTANSNEGSSSKDTSNTGTSGSTTSGAVGTVIATCLLGVISVAML